ncbi:hypothetical protein Tco_0651588 [Tanacetum coccineum]|uniref:Xylulose kinase-1 n=1 Tax=Tanacetum coccineum TaxID=301880 RepID=A0ABQ4WV69_9ASTR
MSTPKFAETHNLVAFLEKPEESNGFEGIIDFLNASSIKYALTVNPTVYESCIQQFWATAKAKTVNRERQIQALVDKKKVIITEKSVRSDLMLDDAEGTECLPNDVIFEQLTLMGMVIESAPRLEKSKTAQAKEIASLKKRVKQLEKRRKLRTPGLKRLRKVGSTSRVESSNDVSLGDQEDASKQGRKIVDLDADAEVTLVDETQEMNDDNLMFDNTGFVWEEQEKIKIKAAKPKAITSAATTTTTTRPKARVVVVQEPSEFKTTSSPLQASQLPQAKDKGKAIMVEPKRPLKKKDQVALDEEMARNLEALRCKLN